MAALKNPMGINKYLVEKLVEGCIIHVLFFSLLMLPQFGPHLLLPTEWLLVVVVAATAMELVIILPLVLPTLDVGQS